VVATTGFTGAPPPRAARSWLSAPKPPRRCATPKTWSRLSSRPVGTSSLPQARAGPPYREGLPLAARLAGDYPYHHPGGEASPVGPGRDFRPAQEGGLRPNSDPIGSGLQCRDKVFPTTHRPRVQHPRQPPRRRIQPHRFLGRGPGAPWVAAGIRAGQGGPLAASLPGRRHHQL